MSITIDQLQKAIAETRAQAEAHNRDAIACAGAVQAYEQLLSQLIQAARLAAVAPPQADAPVKVERKRK